MSPTAIPGNLLLKNGMVITGREADPLLLDSYSGAAAAYSLRQLSWAYGGPVVRVRRDNNNAEQDFTATEVSDGTLATWVGAGNNGFVRTWYDQSGNGRNAEQSTEANQPQLVSGGVLLLENNTPALNFDGINDSLRADNVATAIGTISSTQTLVMVARSTKGSPPGTSSAFVSYGSSTTTEPVFFTGQASASQAGLLSHRTTSLIDTPITAGNVNSQSLFSVFAAQTSRSLQINNGSPTTSALDIGSGGIVNQFAIGCLSRTTDALFALGNVQEVIVYHSNMSSLFAGIRSNINAHYSIYP
jgi:hypothetical protein